MSILFLNILKSTLTVGLVYRSPNISMEENEKIHNAINQGQERVRHSIELTEGIC